MRVEAPVDSRRGLHESTSVHTSKIYDAYFYETSLVDNLVSETGFRVVKNEP